MEFLTRKSSLVTAMRFVLTASVCHDGHSMMHSSKFHFSSRCGSRFRSPPTERKISSAIGMFVDGVFPGTFSVPTLPILPSNSATISLVTTSISTASDVLSSTSHLITSDPRLEAELLDDVSLVLDFTTFFSPNTLWLRFFNVLGRLLFLFSDYIQDGYIYPEECFFQVFLLAISINSLLQSIMPLLLVASSNKSFTFRDKRAYKLFFEEVGLSFLQYKALFSSEALSWIEVAANEKIDLNGTFMYWSYSGEVKVPTAFTFDEKKCMKAENENLINYTRDVVIDEVFMAPTFHEATSKSRRMFGEVQFVKALETSMYKTDNCKKIDNARVQYSSSYSLYDHTQLVSGSNGAILLQICTSRLIELMKNDDQLANSIHRLLLSSMQEKIHTSIHKTI